MTKKDYERAATQIQRLPIDEANRLFLAGQFVEFFADDNSRFDEARFRAACVPGANVKARGKKVTA